MTLVMYHYPRTSVFFPSHCNVFSYLTCVFSYLIYAFSYFMRKHCILSDTPIHTEYTEVLISNIIIPVTDYS